MQPVDVARDSVLPLRPLASSNLDTVAFNVGTTMRQHFRNNGSTGQVEHIKDTLQAVDALDNPVALHSLLLGAFESDSRSADRVFDQMQPYLRYMDLARTRYGLDEATFKQNALEGMANVMYFNNISIPARNIEGSYRVARAPRAIQGVGEIGRQERLAASSPISAEQLRQDLAGFRSSVMAQLELLAQPNRSNAERAESLQKLREREGEFTLLIQELAPYIFGGTKLRELNNVPTKTSGEELTETARVLADTLFVQSGLGEIAEVLSKLGGYAMGFKGEYNVATLSRGLNRVLERYGAGRAMARTSR